MPPLPTRRIAGFALRFGLAYGLLLLAWPLIGFVYRPVYCALGNLAFEGGEASAHFQQRAPGPRDDGFDIEVVLTRRGPPPVTGRMNSSSRLVGYLPTVILLALILATPISWRRRWRALWIGGLLVTAFVALRMAIPLLQTFSAPGPLQVHERGALAHWLLSVLDRAFLAAPASWFVVPIFIWIGVALRRRDWELLEPRRDPTP